MRSKKRHTHIVVGHSVGELGPVSPADSVSEESTIKNTVSDDKRDNGDDDVQYLNDDVTKNPDPHLRLRVHVIVEIVLYNCFSTSVCGTKFFGSII